MVFRVLGGPGWLRCWCKMRVWGGSVFPPCGGGPGGVEGRGEKVASLGGVGGGRWQITSRHVGGACLARPVLAHNESRG